MSEQAKEKGQQKPNKESTQSGCHGNSSCSSDSCHDGGNAAGCSDCLCCSKSPHVSQKSGLIHRAASSPNIENRSGVRADGGGRTFVVDLGSVSEASDYDYSAFSPLQSPNYNGYPRNGSCRSKDEKAALERESCVRVNSLNESNHTRSSSSMSHVNMIGLTEASSSNRHSFLKSYFYSFDQSRQSVTFNPKAESVSFSASSEMPRGNILPHEIDLRYQNDPESFGEPQGCHGNARSGLGSIQFSNEVDGGAACGGLEDLGDFIDADIPRNLNGWSSQLSSRSNDSITSSFEELASTAGIISGGGGVKTMDSSVDSLKDVFDNRPGAGHSYMTNKSREKRITNCSVNNLNQSTTERYITTAVVSSVDNFPLTLNHMANPMTCSWDSLNFGRRGGGGACGQAKSWRWSDSDATEGRSHVNPSLTASLASDLSCGTPSAQLVSPFSIDDDVLASALSSPDAPGQSRTAQYGTLVAKEYDEEHLMSPSNSEGSRTSQTPEPLFWQTSSLEPTWDVLSFKCEMCSSILDNMNQTDPKHLLEKYFGWDAEETSSESATPVHGKILANGYWGATNCKEPEHHCPFGKPRASSISHVGMSAADVSLLHSRLAADVLIADKCLESLRLGEKVIMPRNRRFSCQNLCQTDSSNDFLALSKESHVQSMELMGLTNALSDDSLQLTTTTAPLPSQLRPMLPLSLKCSANCECVKCCHLMNRKRKSGTNSSSCVEPFWRADEPSGSNKNEKKMNSAQSSAFLSFSEDEIEEEDKEEDIEKRMYNHRQYRHENNARLVSSAIAPTDFLSSQICQADLGLDFNSHDQNPVSEGVDSILRQNRALSCGAGPVICLLKFLGVNVANRLVCEMMHSNPPPPMPPAPREKTSLIGFLLSSSSAGISAEQLIAGLARLTKDLVYGKFFHFYPRRNVNIFIWLKEWMRKGAVPLATIKCDSRDGSGDVWHHRIIHSIEPAYGLNDLFPMATEETLPKILSIGHSSIRIARHDIVSRWRDDCDLNALMFHKDTRWQEMNVLGQVVNVLREERLQTAAGGYRPQQTSHVLIPTHFKSGITLFLRTDSAAYEELRTIDCQLPLATEMVERNRNGKAYEKRVEEVEATVRRRTNVGKQKDTFIRETVIF